MSDELFELKEMVKKLEGKNAELVEKMDKLEAKNAELIDKNDKLEEEIESLKLEISQQKNSTESNIAIQTSQSQPMEGLSDFAPIIEKPKQRKRFFKNWLLFDTLPWINRKELANSSMSTANETFRQLCWPKLHGNVKLYKIPELRISGVHLELGKFRALLHLRTRTVVGADGWTIDEKISEEIVPIASIPPLDYILGIGQIEINFVNDEVVNFFKSIAKLLRNCQLEMSVMNKKQQIASVRTLMDFLANKNILLDCGRPFNQLHLNDFNTFFPGFIDNIQFIRTWGTKHNNDEIDIILNWLTKQSNNVKQKLLEFHLYEKFMSIFNSRITEEFSNSNSPSNFVIDFGTTKNREEFIQKNVRTNEILALYRKTLIDWAEYSNYYIARYPKGEEHWKEDGENKIREYRTAGNFTSISINMA